MVELGMRAARNFARVDQIEVRPRSPRSRHSETTPNAERKHAGKQAPSFQSQEEKPVPLPLPDSVGPLSDRPQTLEKSYRLGDQFGGGHSTSLLRRRSREE